jgi:hypothetical protein
LRWNHNWEKVRTWKCIRFNSFQWWWWFKWNWRNWKATWKTWWSENFHKSWNNNFPQNIKIIN